MIVQVTDCIAMVACIRRLGWTQGEIADGLDASYLATKASNCPDFDNYVLPCTFIAIPSLILSAVVSYFLMLRIVHINIQLMKLASQISASTLYCMNKLLLKK